MKNIHFPVCWSPFKVETTCEIGRLHLLSQNKILFHQHILKIPQTHEDNGEKHGLALLEETGEAWTGSCLTPGLKQPSRLEQKHSTIRKNMLCMLPSMEELRDKESFIEEEKGS